MKTVEKMRGKKKKKSNKNRRKFEEKSEKNRRKSEKNRRKTEKKHVFSKRWFFILIQKKYLSYFLSSESDQYQKTTLPHCSIRQKMKNKSTLQLSK